MKAAIIPDKDQHFPRGNSCRLHQTPCWKASPAFML